MKLVSKFHGSRGEWPSLTLSSTKGNLSCPEFHVYRGDVPLSQQRSLFGAAGQAAVMPTVFKPNIEIGSSFGGS